MMFRSMLRSASALAILCASASPQGVLAPQRITAPIKDRGTYHVATGTWTRANPSNNFYDDSQVVFNNTAPTGYFFGTTGGFNTVDHGRIPSTSSPAGPDSVVGWRDDYAIRGFQLGYCSSIPAAAGGVDFMLTFYEEYGPCTDVDIAGGIPVVASFIGTGLAGGTPASASGCWITSFNLSNTTLGFVLGADADGTWDNVGNMDSFGWGLDMLNATMGTAGNGTGPFMAGNCPVGGVTVPQRGFQTVFGGNEGATDSTGLGTNDFFWIGSAALGTTSSPNGGCFFFGGCTTGVVGPANNPYSSYWLQLFADGPDYAYLGTPFCSSMVNASGSRAVMCAFGGDPNADLRLTVSGLPNSTGQLFFGTMGFDTPGMAMLGDGPLCAAMGVIRINPLLSAGMMMQPPNRAFLDLSYSAPYATSFTGIRYFQHWYRSTLATGTGSNGSSGVKINF